jgi:hypothetical protein
MSQKQDFPHQHLQLSQSLSDYQSINIKTEENIFDQLPQRRQEEFHDIGRKKIKKLPVSYEEWQPYSEILLNLAETNQFNGTPADILEQQKLALTMTTPEGLQEIINNLEEKLSKYEDLPTDPVFESLSISEKIENLFKDLSSKYS